MATWTIDQMHSEISFKVKHLLISTISGKFDNFEGTLVGEKEDFTDAEIKFSAVVNSVNTNSQQRDEHLKSADFFDAAHHPQLSFTSKSIINKDGNNYELTGNLTIKGITKSITLRVELGGIGPNSYGQTIAGFELLGKINRKDFGLNWSAVTEAGGIVVGDEVKIIANVELVKSA